ncbi:phosphoesterase [Desulfospira joergensenii]|uniref:phosphoesterase n=1 Tax=Desulfospira joergensenii TaxID=53329 RepID=UPI0003B40F4A|nr:phosphoesterase [Desulfospira joergensenii]
MASEKVLCIPRNRLPRTWVEKKSVAPSGFKKFIDQCTQAGFDFIARSKAEKDNSLKQIIPYIVIQTSDLGQTAVYNRQGSEERLHDLWSLGIGGHINPVDNSSRIDSFQDILEAGMIRELTEELEKRPNRDIPQFSGIINEELTDVGSVHLGAVFRILTREPQAYTPGPELFDFKWVDTSSLKELNMELWSELALELFDLSQK